MIAKRILEKLSVKTLETLLESKKRSAALVPLERKRDKLRAELEKIEARIARLTGSVPVKKAQPKKRKLTVAARRKMAAAAKARWAKVRAAKKTVLANKETR